MSDLYFGKTEDEANVYTRTYVQQLWRDVYGTGGLKDVAEFITNYKATEREREKQESIRHQENKDRLDLIVARSARNSWIIAALAALVVTVELIVKFWK